MSRVLVSHPGRQHSHRAALALERAGRLAAYWSGVPSLASQRGIVPLGLWRQWIRPEPIPLPAERARAWPSIPAIRRLGNALPTPVGSRVDLAACRRFDRIVAARLARTDARAVLACEISALETFRRARTLGWKCLLDAPAFHADEQDRRHRPSAPAAVHRRIRAIKLAEIEAADVVVTVSELARASYLAAGVPEEKVIAVPLGADLERFGAAPSGPRDGPLRIAFVGATIERKGFDLLVEALSNLVTDGLPFHLRLVGPRGGEWSRLEALPREIWSEAGSIPQSDLPRELAACDLLVLPSRSDSYGMVVAEALAAGRPCVVSDQVGAAPLVAGGEVGWIVPAGDAGALAERLAEIARDPERARRCEDACRTRAREATWESYERRFVAALAPWLDGGAR